MNVSYPIIDADGHVMEKDAELREFLEGRYREGPHFQTYSFFPSLDGWNRGFGVPGKIHETPASKWLEFLDELGVHTTVLYPTGRSRPRTHPESGMVLCHLPCLQFLDRRALHQTESAA